MQYVLKCPQKISNSPTSITQIKPQTYEMNMYFNILVDENIIFNLKYHHHDNRCLLHFKLQEDPPPCCMFIHCQIRLKL